MSDTPNPWSREGSADMVGNRPAEGSGQWTGQPQAGPASNPWSQQAGGTPSKGQGHGQSYPGYPQGYAQQTSQQTSQQYQGQSQASVTATATKSRKPRRAGRLTATVLGITMLAGGVGAGSAVLTTQYLDGRRPAAVTQTQDQGTSSGTTQGTTVKQADPNNPNWTAVADVARKSVVAIQVASGLGGAQGSGVVIDEQGHIVTNNHVVNGAQQLRVTLGDSTYDAELVGTDPSTDLAVIRLVNPPEDLQPIAWGDSNALKVGDPVMAIGNPLGLSNTVTTGIVSALDRPVTTQAVESQTDQSQQDVFPGQQQSSSDAVVTAAIQTNAAINPGNSGGALVNASGQLVGITSSIATLSGSQQSSSQSGSIGLGFAISAHQAQHVAKQLINSGTAVYPQIGVTASDPQTTGQLGAQVAAVVDGSPAAKAGLQPGDIVTSIAGRSVSSTSQLVGLVRAQEVGQTVEVGFVRDGEAHTVQMELVASGR